MTDVVALVEAAKAKGTFSVLEVAQGLGYPQDIVTIYTDQNSARKITQIDAQIKELKDKADSAVADETNTDVVNEVDAALDEALKALKAQRESLLENVKASGLTFHLRGIGSGVIEGIQDEARTKFEDIDFGDGAKWCNSSFLAAHIVQVVDAQDRVDAHKWSQEEVEELRKTIVKESFDKLLNLMRELTFAAAYFDAAISTDF